MEATTVTLADLWPMMATLVGSLLAFVVVIMRLLHVSILGVRNRIGESAKESRELFERSSRESRELIKENRELIERSSRESRELIEKVHAELAGGLAEVRERLAYIEGYLKPSSTPPPEDDDAAEAA